MSTPRSSDSERHQTQSLLKKKFGARVQFNQTLAPLVAYRIGGPGDIIIFPDCEEELDWIARLARTSRIPVTIIGGGTNILVPDEGIRGITLFTTRGFKKIYSERKNENIWVTAEGGVEKSALIDWAIDHELSGLEFSSGIPGTIGGGIFMNAGTKYGCYADLLEQTRIYDFRTGVKTFSQNTQHFGYRKQDFIKYAIVISATFRLTPGNASEIRKRVLEIIQEREAKQPLDFPSCGSTFKNPEGFSAGRLIEKSGLKGLREGDAEISTKHANFILNRGKATARDVISLMERIQQTVRNQFQIDLEPEVIILDPLGSFSF